MSLAWLKLPRAGDTTRAGRARRDTRKMQKQAAHPPRAPAVGMRAPALEASQEKLEEFLTSE